ncbi:MAG: DNA polymerase I [Clostridia bacterium]|nr:DNA polymerase I [Clostridia bacterium]
MKNKVLLLDSNSLVNRAFYAIPFLSNSEGIYTNAIVGYINMLTKIISEEHPTHICAVFDFNAKTFRHKLYKEYKGQRKPMPSELSMQIPLLQDLLRKLNICVINKEGYEADDIIGTIAKQFGEETIIVSGDKDVFQLIDDNITVFHTKRGITEVIKYNESRLLEDGFKPYQIIEYKGLAGDSSDNIKGCPGVGEKTAKDLLKKYDNIDNIYENISNIKGSLHDKLSGSIQDVYLSKRLATIDIKVPLEIKLDDIIFNYSSINSDAYELINKLKIKNTFQGFEKLLINNKTDSITPKSISKKVTKVIEIKEVDHLKELVDFILNENNQFYFEYLQDFLLISNKETEYHIYIIDQLLGEGISSVEAFDIIKPIFESNINKLFFNAKLYMHFLKKYSITINQPFDDLQLMSYLVNSQAGLKTSGDLIYYYLDDSDNYIDLYENLKDRLNKLNNFSLYKDIELPLVSVLYEMETTGFCTDLETLNTLSIKYGSEINELTEKIYSIAGEKFNINSNKQLSDLLYNKLNLNPLKKNKTGFSVDADSLAELDHPIIDLLLRYREITKLKSTYIDGLINLRNPNSGKIYTTFNQCITATGRLSSTEPNLQNIPVRKNEGKEIRRIFIPSKPTNFILSSDYSQIELRLLAHLSEDKNLLSAYSEGDDIHALTASKMFHTPLDEVTPIQRSNAKAINFGIVYGISRYGLAQNTNISQKEAKTFIDQYFNTYPKVKEYMDNNIYLGKEQGYLSSILGRVRYFPDLHNSKYMVRAAAERQAMNFPLQASASDIIKLAMIKVQKFLIDNKCKSKMMLQVHDELIFDVVEEELDLIKTNVKTLMENVLQLKVPLITNVSYGKNWLDAK